VGVESSKKKKNKKKQLHNFIIINKIFDEKITKNALQTLIQSSLKDFIYSRS